MVISSNDHKVHTDDHHEQRGPSDWGAMLDDLADEIGQIDGVTAAEPDRDIDGAYLVVDHDGDERVEHAVRDVLSEWACTAPRTGDDWIEVRPA